MKNKKRRFGAKSKMAVAATIMTVPVLAVAQKPKADAPPAEKDAASRSASAHLKFAEKIHGTYTIVGSDKGHIVFKNAAGKYFWIDPATGDQKFLPADVAIKTDGSERSAMTIKMRGSQVTVLGVDPKGHIIETNARGEKFYLNPATGDMVFVK